jgi:plastocyanin
MIRLATLACCAALVATQARAQATVSGTLSIEERQGADHGDPRTAVVYLEPRGVMHAADAPALREGTIAMRGREFIPHVRVIRAGGSVAFPNQDPFSHNVFSNVEHGAFDLGLYRSGKSKSEHFGRPGVYPIYCNIHSKMVSFVVAVPGPWYAHPDADGRFSLRGVPAGAYVLHAWHERGSDEVRREIVVPPNGLRDLQLSIDARTYVAAGHLNKFGLPYSVVRADRY